MTLTEYPGAAYGEFWPSGVGYAVPLVPDGKDVLFIRVSAGGKIAGQGHNDGHAWEFDGTAWIDHGPCVGVSPVAYGGERLYISRADGVYCDGVRVRDGYIGSQGIRWVDETGIHSGDETYSDGQIAEYTDCGDLRIGQGMAGGLVVRIDGVYRQVAPATVRFVRANRVGDAVAIYWTDFVKGYRLLTTRAELAVAPPVVAAPLPTPVPVPQPPTPEPQPMPAPANRLADVQRIRAKYPTPLGESHWRFLVEVCQAVGAQLYRKDGGDHVFVPPLNRYVSLDVIGRGALGDWWIDILGDAENEARPAWDAHEGAAGEYLDVSGIVLDGSQPTPQTPPPSNPPPAPSVDLSAILARLDVSDARTVQALSELTASVHRLIAAVEAQKPPVIDMTVTTFPDYRGAVPYLGTITLKPVK